MKARPILMSAPMVKSLLAGEKAQTRRTTGLDEVNKYPDEFTFTGFETFRGKYQACFDHCADEHHQFVTSPYGRPGDALWVREAYLKGGLIGVEEHNKHIAQIQYVYRADVSGNDPLKGLWKPSIHMPRAASRLTLGLVNLRIERLHDISEDDAIAEGIWEDEVIVDADCAPGYHREITGTRYFFKDWTDEGFEDPVDAYAALWRQINGEGSWEKNPWVWVIDFPEQVHKQNVTEFLKTRAA